MAHPEDQSRPKADVETNAESVDMEIGESAGIHRDSPRGGSEVDRLRAELQDAEDRTLRAQAELENFRRRARREIEEERKFANQPLLGDVFPVLDNIDRALAAAQQSNEQAGGLLKGFEMVSRQLLDSLAKHGCTRISAQGEVFDPALHEAISQQPSHEYPSGTVAIVAQEGYRLHDRVIRPAQVVVSTGPPSESSA